MQFDHAPQLRHQFPAAFGCPQPVQTRKNRAPPATRVAAAHSWEFAPRQGLAAVLALAFEMLEVGGAIAAVCAAGAVVAGDAAAACAGVIVEHFA